MSQRKAILTQYRGREYESVQREGETDREFLQRVIDTFGSYASHDLLGQAFALDSAIETEGFLFAGDGSGITFHAAKVVGKPGVGPVVRIPKRPRQAPRQARDPGTTA